MTHLYDLADGDFYKDTRIIDLAALRYVVDDGDGAGRYSGYHIYRLGFGDRGELNIEMKSATARSLIAAWKALQ